jgi:hypothetical protein
MATRKPAVLELVGGKSSRQRVWESVRTLGARGYTDDDLALLAPLPAFPYFARHCAGFTADELSRLSKVEYEPVRYLLKGWVAAGYLEILSGWSPGGRGVKNVYRLAVDNGVEAPRVRPNGAPIEQGRGQEALWAAITALDSFQAAFVAEIAQVPVTTARAYCGVLARAGYLRSLPTGKGRKPGGPVWAVAPQHKDKPRAPMVTRLKALYDPNVHEIVWAETADDALEAIDVGEVSP